MRAHTQSGAASYWRDGSAPDKGVGKEFEYKDDWGELSTGKRVSRLFVLHVSSNTVKMVQGNCVTPAFFSPPPPSLSRSLALVRAGANTDGGVSVCALERAV